MFDILGARADQLKIFSRGTEGAAYVRETTFRHAADNLKIILRGTESASYTREKNLCLIFLERAADQLKIISRGTEDASCACKTTFWGAPLIT